MARKAQRPREGPTLQQRLFVHEYFQTKPLNAAAAYRKVYRCSEEAAATNGPRLLRNARVSPLVVEMQKALEARSALSIERMDRELECSAAFDPADILDPETGTTLPVHRWPEHARRALAGFEEEALFDMVPTGEVGPRGGEKKVRVQVGVVRKFKWHDKTSAQKLWYQRRGALVEKVQDVTPDGDATAVTEEELAELALLRHEVRGRKRGGGDAG